MKKSNLRKLNAIIWVVLGTIFMIGVYKIWNINGTYNFLSFFSSLVFHGGFCFLIGYLIDEAITNHFNK